MQHCGVLKPRVLAANAHNMWESLFMRTRECETIKCVHTFIISLLFVFFYFAVCRARRMHTQCIWIINIAFTAHSHLTVTIHHFFFVLFNFIFFLLWLLWAWMRSILFLSCAPIDLVYASEWGNLITMFWYTFVAQQHFSFAWVFFLWDRKYFITRITYNVGMLTYIFYRKQHSVTWKARKKRDMTR